jgi:hypothetical protein
VVAAALVVAVILPSVVVHYANANHRIPPLADRYASRVLAALPRNSVFLAGGWEFANPIVNRQVLYGDRPDVAVVSADTLSFEWYRNELVHRLGLDPSLVRSDGRTALASFVTVLRRTRPVFADTYAVLAYGDRVFGYQAAGLVSRVVDGTGPQPNPDFETAAATTKRDEQQDGFTVRSYRHFPNTALYFFYERAHVELAKQYALADNLDQAANELERALVFAPENHDRSAIQIAREHQPNAKKIILSL